MIPGFIDEDAPPGERTVYHALSAGPPDWVVVHSLDIAPWNNRRRTEIDFMVIIPDTGILCVEVKSHPQIWVEDGTWQPSRTIKRSPFKQALDARYSLAKGLARVWPHAANIPFGQCCIFPSADFDLTDTVGVRQHELMARRRFSDLETGEARCSELREMFKTQLGEEGGQQPLHENLAPPLVDNLLEACLPVRKRQPTAREEVRRREEEAGVALREQQRPVLQLAELNPRLVVTGGAGTGKTLIAMELARRAAARGDRVALLCFNQLVGDWMTRKMAGAELPNLIVGRAWKVMADIAGTRIPAGASRAFWDEKLPTLIEAYLTDPSCSSTAEFDLMIIDEAQDVLGRSRMWGCLAQFITGGLEAGRFVLFGDFEGQVLGDLEASRSALDELCRDTGPARWKLTENCRNYKVIGRAAVELSGTGRHAYTGYRRDGGSIPLNFRPAFYGSNEEQMRLVEQCIREARTDGFKAEDITLLSMCADEKGVAESLRRTGHMIFNCREAREGIQSASIHAFKGMENKVIIITDVELVGRENERNLFYTAITRATERVRILCNVESQPILLAWMQGDLSA